MHSKQPYNSAVFFGIQENLPATLIFNYPTIESLTNYLLKDVLELDEKEKVKGVKKKKIYVKGDSIAVVGMGLRFPGIDSGEELWRILKEGKDAISKIPSWKWNIEQYYSEDRDALGKMYVNNIQKQEAADQFEKALNYKINPLITVKTHIYRLMNSLK